MSEQHKQQFRGVWIPAEIFNLLKAKKITAMDMALLSIIDSLVSPEHGCYASNKYLAEQVGLKVRRLQMVLDKLQGMGLLKSVGFSGRRRILETAWSRVARRTRVHGRGALECTADVHSSAPLTNNKENKNSKGTTMPFFETKQTSKHPPSPFDIQVGQTLHKIVTEQLAIRQRYSMKKWADEIRKLRNELNGDEKRISKAIDFYSKHAGKKGLPKITSGTSFRKCFAWLEECIAKQSLDQKVLGISDAAKAISKPVTIHLNWPKGSKEQIPAAVQLSLDATNKFRRRLSLYVAQVKHPSPMLKDLAEHIMGKLRNVEHFVERWFFDVNASIQNWSEWSGDLKPFVVSVESKRFQKWGLSITSEYCHEPKRWTKLMEALEYGS